MYQHVSMCIVHKGQNPSISAKKGNGASTKIEPLSCVTPIAR